jgi:DNA-binding winged helix-turn-helix (wHTH) protein/Tol biopolymer transport system component
MRWKFGCFEFDENTKVLSSSNQTLQLEPKTSALLGYFCRHPQTDISRDTLLEFVWHGQIVTDGAINRVILKLRKALLDEEKLKVYITTVPKVGYRFIAQVSPITNTSVSAITESKLIENQSGQALAPHKSLHFIWSLTLLLVIVLAGVFYDQTSDNKNVVVKPLISPITRLAEVQFDASLSHNTELLAYSTHKNDEVAIFVVDPKQQNPSRISMQGGDAFNAHWSQDDNEIIYLFHQQDVCQFHRVTFIAGIAQIPEVLYQCSGDSFTTFSYDQTQQKLYFVESETHLTPYYAYELDLEKNSKRRLSQPIALGKGNHLLQRHEQSGRLLLLSDQKPGKTTAYELDIENNTFEILIDFDYAITSAVWNHQADGLVHPDLHPSYRLLMTYFDQRKTEVLVTDSNRISQVGSIDNGKDYLFTSYMNNRDIEINNQIDPSYNSSVMDYLPQLNRDGSQLAFISKRTGYSKIWLVDLANNNLRSIEPPDKGRTFYSLQWSFDNRYILANTDSGIIVFDSRSLTVLTMINPDLPTYAVGWLANDEVGYSLYQGKRWQLYQQNINSKVNQKHDQRWAFSVASPKGLLHVNQSMALYFNESLVPSELNCVYPISRMALTVQLDGESLYCVAAQDKKTILKYSPQLGIQSIRSGLSRIRRFSVNDENVATTKLVSSRSDIIRTNF